jgi:O-antigen/teichoic acid export membrane protein
VPDPSDITTGIGRRLGRNLTMQSGTQALSVCLSVVTTYVLSRKLGVEVYGGFRFLFTFIYFFQALNDLGINTMLIREISQRPERTNDLVRHLLGFKILIAVGLMLAAWVSARIFPMPPFARLAVSVFALILPIQAMTLPFVVLQARVQIAQASVVELTNRLTGFALMMTAVWLGYGLLGVTAALVGGEIAGLAVVILLTRRVVLPVPHFNVAVWREVLALSLPLGAAGLLVALVNRVDFMMLEAMGGLKPLGYYGAAYGVTGLFERVPLLIMATLYPLLSRLAAGDPEPLGRLYHRSLRNFSLGAVPVVGLVTWFAPVIVRLQFGPAYGPAVGLLRILIWATGCLYVAIVGGNLLIALGQQRVTLRAWLLAAAVNIGLNVIWIPRYGATGAAYATTISFGIVLVITLTACERLLADARRRHAVPRAGAPDGVPSGVH